MLGVAAVTGGCWWLVVGHRTMQGHREGTVPDELHGCDGAPAGGAVCRRLTNARSRALSTASSHPSMLQPFRSSKKNIYVGAWGA